MANRVDASAAVYGVHLIVGSEEPIALVGAGVDAVGAACGA